jgi:hypothetical protein
VEQAGNGGPRRVNGGWPGLNIPVICLSNCTLAYTIVHHLFFSVFETLQGQLKKFPQNMDYRQTEENIEFMYKIRLKKILKSSK